tara:strand:+ start:441 stop:890 length:450 start_codon:yes stop_codon:yes gene_type:complete
MSYSKLSEHFKARTPYKYNKEVHFDGTKIIATENKWTRDQNGRWYRRQGTDKIVLAEHIEHNGKEYAVVYNRGNKCFATEVLMWGFNSRYRSNRCGNLKYGELGKPTKDQQRAYRCQMIDSLIYSGVITHILIPTTLEGDSAFFKLLEG